MKINPETLHTKFDIYPLIIFLIIICRYKKNNKNIYKIALERYICFHMSYYRGWRSPLLNLQHTQKYHGNYGECCFLVTIPNLDVVINDPFYYKILCSSSFNVQRVTTRMEYFMNQNDLDFWCFNATFSNISVISWRPVLVVEEAGVPGENHRP